jgi:hypothetical protein
MHDRHTVGRFAPARVASRRDSATRHIRNVENVGLLRDLPRRMFWRALAAQVLPTIM